MKILVSAYACEPGEGSEPGIGWNQVRQIARFHDVWVITRSNNRGVIEEAVAKEPMPNMRWVYCDLPRWARFWKKGGRGLRTYYLLWQLGAYLVARKLHREVHFDLAHHVTFGNYWLPIFLPLLPIPFVWGPVGGGESAPRSFRHAFGLRGWVYEVLRDLGRTICELDPLVRLTAHKAAAALATTDQTEKRLLAVGSRNVVIFPGIGLSAEDLHELNALETRQGTPFRVLSLGRLLHWKGFELGVKAFARFHARFPDSEYWLIGDGPERDRLERLARKLGLGDKVVLWGQIPRDHVLKKLAACDLLLFPSLHDSGGWVCLEAMAAARPVVCLDLGGPGLQVTEATGVKVPAITPEQVVADLATALETLASDPLRRVKLGDGGRARISQEFNWDRKGERLAALYEQVVRVSEPVDQAPQYSGVTNRN